MPIPLLGDIVFRGPDSIPYVLPVLKALPWVVLTWLAKWYFGGASNTSERLMHSKVIMVTVRIALNRSYRYNLHDSGRHIRYCCSSCS